MVQKDLGEFLATLPMFFPYIVICGQYEHFLVCVDQEKHKIRKKNLVIKY